MMNTPEWIDPQTAVAFLAEELGNALVRHGIGFMGVHGGVDGDITVAFGQLADAEAMMTLGVISDDTPGSLYDRATSSCVTLATYTEANEPTDDELVDVIRAGWTWNIHPAMQGRRMGWHAAVDMSLDDAATVTANLNVMYHRAGGAS